MKDATVVTPPLRVVCIIQCPEAMNALRDFVELNGENGGWSIDYADLMIAATHAAAGDMDKMGRTLECITGISMLHRDEECAWLMSAVEAIGLGIRHALPEECVKDNKVIVQCDHMGHSRQHFIFNLTLLDIKPLGDNYTVIHF